MEEQIQSFSKIHRMDPTTRNSDTINRVTLPMKTSQNELQTPEILNTDKSFQYEIINKKNMSDTKTLTKTENNKLVKLTKVVLVKEEIKKDPVLRVVTSSYNRISKERDNERYQEGKVGVVTNVTPEKDKNSKDQGIGVFVSRKNVGVAINDEEDEKSRNHGNDVNISKENTSVDTDAICDEDEIRQNQETEVTMYLDISCDAVSEDDSQSDSIKSYLTEDDQRIDFRNNFKIAPTNIHKDINKLNKKMTRITASPNMKEEVDNSAANIKNQSKIYRNKHGRFCKQSRYSKKQLKYFGRSKGNQSLQTQNKPTKNTGTDHQYIQSEETSRQETNGTELVEDFSSKRKRKCGESIKCKFCNYYHLKNSCLLFVFKNLKEDRSSCANSEILSLTSLPSQLTLKFTSELHGISVYASELIRISTQFGPVLGTPLEFKDLSPTMDFSHVWISTCGDGNDAEYLSTKDEMQSNWCRYLRSSFYLEECNVVSFIHNKQVFFTVRRDVTPGEELVIYHMYYEQLSASPVYAKLFTDSETNRFCIRCKYQFNSWANYTKHIKIFHPKGSMMMKNECKECGLILFSNNELTKHCKIEHQGRGAFICQEENCGRHFTNFERLKYHQKLQHFPEGNYKCELCDKVFPNPLKRKNHIRWVHSESVFRCNICDKQFKRRECLFRHEKIHGTNFKFCCDRCGKQCRDRTNLKVHLLTHSKIKPFQCQELECTAGFTTKQCLQNHYKKTHKYTDENLPEIIRSVPFTEEAHGKQNEFEQTVGFENLLQSVPLTMETHGT